MEEEWLPKRKEQKRRNVEKFHEKNSFLLLYVFVFRQKLSHLLSKGH